MTQGAVLWEGPSRLNGEPIVVIATGLDGTSKNSKTGAMVQTWILHQQFPPGKAVRTGADAAICGDCIHRVVNGLSTCYVNVAFGPSRVWEAYKKGIYPQVTPEVCKEIKKHHVRFGSYGDPVAVSKRVWSKIRPKDARDHTGYTHAWNTRHAFHHKDFLMASVESEAEAKEAKAKGWRCFLVVPRNRPVPKAFKWCPSDELNPNKKVLCEDCGVCNGVRGAQSSDIAIYAHGSTAASFTVNRQRKSLVELGNRHHLQYDAILRVDRNVHTDLKKHCKERGVFVKRWLEKMIRAQIAREKPRSRREA